MHNRGNTRVHHAEGSEEGEIVDSEEEQDMIQRIRELEAKNEELEKIASISGEYTNQFHYGTECESYKSRVQRSNTKKTFMNQNDVARIPSDASSISSDEIEPVKKRNKRKGKHFKKEHSNKICFRSNSFHKRVHRSHKFDNNIKLRTTPDIYRMQKKIHLKNDNSPILINDNYLETISLDSDEDSVVDINKSDCDYIDPLFQLNRDKLRLALVHDRTNETRSGNLLKERLYNGNALVEHKENISTCDNVRESSLDVVESENKSQISEQSLEHSGKEECATQEEQELRLIALKSAILKKHLARKKRNAEMAYSPTDFAPVPVNFNTDDDNMDVVEEELDELNDVMEISPINSPKLVLSPSNEEDQSQNNFKGVGDNNSIDMDISQSNSEEEFRNSQNEQWYPIETAPISYAIDPNETLKYPLPVHYAIYVPEMQYQFPPPSVLHSENRDLIDNQNLVSQSSSNLSKNFIADEEPPPPPSMFFKKHSSKALAMYSEKFFDAPPPPFFSDIQGETNKNNVFQQLCTNSEGDNTIHNKNEQQSAQSSGKVQQNFKDEDKDSDEEVSALRAVLLSKLQATKTQKKKITNEVSETLLPTKENPNENEVETVLQKALRRLKSNLNSPPLSLKENDSRIVENYKGFVNSIDVKKVNEQEKKHEIVSSIKNGTVLSLNEKNHIILTSSADEINKGMSTTSDIPVDLNIRKSEEEYTSPNVEPDSSDPKVNNSPLIITKDSNLNRKQCSNEEIIGNGHDICNNGCCSKATKTKENSEAVINQKLKAINSPLTKSIASNENNETKESGLKRKREITMSTPSVRVQPLTIKNNLLPSKNASPKSGNILAQATVNKMRTTRTTKIVRRNKVINKEITTKINRANTPIDSPPSRMQRKILNSKSTSTSTTITASDTPHKIAVKKLIITLRASDTETSDDEILREVCPPVDASVNRTQNTYNEIASPLELLMNSASSSPFRNKIVSLNETSDLATKETTTSRKNGATNEAFEQKLDAFLKNIRKKGSLDTPVSHCPNSSPSKKVENAKSFNTPSAVRHLPLASQDEYRRLVHRMTLLEKQKQTKKSDDDDSNNARCSSKNIPLTTAPIQDEDKIVMKRNAELETLRSYESAYELTSDNIVKLLNKSLSLVAEAKKSKIAKLRYEKRLKELRAELAKVESLFGREEQKFLRMKPQIGASNHFLTALKKKRRNIMENANKLGKSLNGDKYRLNNKVGEEIIAKSRKLHAEIKLVNILKTENIEAFLSVSKSIKDDAVAADPSSVKSDGEVKKYNKMESSAAVDIVSESTTKHDDKVANLSNQHSLKGPQKKANSQDNCTDRSEISTEIMEDKGSENPTFEKGDVSESEKRVELEVRHEDNAAKETNDKEDVNMYSERTVPVYKSPLDHFRHGYGNIDFNSIVCPFEMWGECADISCKYTHMTIGRKRGTELSIKPLNAENMQMNGA